MQKCYWANYLPSVSPIANIYFHYELKLGFSPFLLLMSSTPRSVFQDGWNNIISSTSRETGVFSRTIVKINTNHLTFRRVKSIASNFLKNLLAKQGCLFCFLNRLKTVSNLDCKMTLSRHKTLKTPHLFRSVHIKTHTTAAPQINFPASPIHVDSVCN